MIVSAVTCMEPPKSKQIPASSGMAERNGGGDDLDAELDDPVETEHVEPDGDSPPNPGVAFWIAFNVPQVLLSIMENKYMEMCSACGFAIYQCKVMTSFN